MQIKSQSDYINSAKFTQQLADDVYRYTNKLNSLGT